MPKHDLRKPGSNLWKSLRGPYDENGKSFSVYAGFGKLRFRIQAFSGQNAVDRPRRKLFSRRSLYLENSKR